MAPDQPEWQIPAAVRVLVWWPPIAFVLVTIAPETAPVTIAAAGALLGVLGWFTAVLGQRPAPAAEVGAEAVPGPALSPAAPGA